MSINYCIINYPQLSSIIINYQAFEWSKFVRLKKNIASLGHDSSLRPEAPAPVAPMANGGSKVGTSRGTDR